MIRLIFLAMLFVFAPLSLANASTFKEIASATYILYEEGRGVCSATFVTKKLLLTAAHCVDIDSTKEYTIRETTVNENLDVTATFIYNVKLKKINRNNDVATFELADDFGFMEYITPVDVATIEETKAYLLFGSRVVAVGYPLAGDLIIVDGLFATKTKSPDTKVKGLMYKTSADIVPGASGGGLYVEIGGTWKLVGTTYAIDTYANVLVSYLSYFTVIESVRDIL